MKRTIVTIKQKVLNQFSNWMILTVLFGTFACQHRQHQSYSYFSKNWDEFRHQMMSDQITSETYRQQGPFKYKKHLDFAIPISPTNIIKTDLYLTKHSGKAPLAIIVHGNGYNKLAHRKQAERIASWGFHALILQVPNRNHWIQNGRTISRLTKLIHSYPRILHKSIDKSKLILIGHSFGGSAVTIAASQSAPISGLILLDPAVVHPSVSKAMKKVDAPAILLGADPQVFTSKKRWQFFENLSGPIAEISIKGANHNDAQYPSINETVWGFDFTTSQEKQEQFVSSMVASLFSLSFTGKLELAWHIFNFDLRRGIIKKGRVRFSSKSAPKTKRTTSVLLHRD